MFHQDPRQACRVSSWPLTLEVAPSMEPWLKSAGGQAHFGISGLLLVLGVRPGNRLFLLLFTAIRRARWTVISCRCSSLIGGFRFGWWTSLEIEVRLRGSDRCLSLFTSSSKEQSTKVMSLRNTSKFGHLVAPQQLHLYPHHWRQVLH